jgi:hypothetical protein
MSDQSGLPVTPPNPSDEPTKNRKPLIIVIVVVVVLALIAGMYLFQPWKLFTSKEVNEALPSTSSSALPTASATGATTPPPAVGNLTGVRDRFGLTDTETRQGSLIRLTNGTTIVRLTDFKTSDGPDVKVWLSVNPASKAEGARDAKYVDLGDLKGTVGNQNYPVPAAAADQTWGSVVIWCDRFSVPFGAADLNPAPPTTR